MEVTRKTNEDLKNLLKEADYENDFCISDIVFIARTNATVNKRKKLNPDNKAFTCHAFKGLEADYIYIEDDLNLSMLKAMTSSKYEEEKRLYYTAITRARKGLLNARWC